MSGGGGVHNGSVEVLRDSRSCFKLFFICFAVVEIGSKVQVANVLDEKHFS